MWSKKTERNLLVFISISNRSLLKASKIQRHKGCLKKCYLSYVSKTVINLIDI